MSGPVRIDQLTGEVRVVRQFLQQREGCGAGLEHLGSRSDGDDFEDGGLLMFLQASAEQQAFN